MPATECNAIRNGLLGNDTVGFLSRNVIRTSTVSESGFPTSATRSFDFTNEGQTFQSGTVYDHVSPENPSLINGLLDVFYLPWGMNSGYYIILEPQGGPDIMMTATMSGCSVGYVRSDDGAVRVSHHNIKTLDMNTAQRRTLAFAENALHPSDYYHGIAENRGEITFVSEGFGYVFGVRRKGQWTMYQQTVSDWRERDKWTGVMIASAITITSAAIF